MSIKADRQERLTVDRERRRQQRVIEDREFEARSTLRHAGFKLDPNRRFPLAMLEALADVVVEWGQDADYPDEPDGHLWSCGCLRNDTGAHRAGCPDRPEGVRG